MASRQDVHGTCDADKSSHAEKRRHGVSSARHGLRPSFHAALSCNTDFPSAQGCSWSAERKGNANSVWPAPHVSSE